MWALLHSDFEAFSDCVILNLYTVIHWLHHSHTFCLVVSFITILTAYSFVSYSYASYNIRWINPVLKHSVHSECASSFDCVHMSFTVFVHGVCACIHQECSGQWMRQVLWMRRAGEWYRMMRECVSCECVVNALSFKCIQVCCIQYEFDSIQYFMKASFARVYHSAWENGRVNFMTLNATPIWMIHWKYTSEWYTLVNGTCRWMIVNSGDVWIVNDNDPKCICMSREHLNATLQKCMRMHVLGIKMWMQQVNTWTIECMK